MAHLRSFPFLAVPALLATLAVVPLARADALPPTACEATGAAAGDSCTTAGPNADEDGVCAQETCSSAGNPFADAAPSSYPCLLCELPDAGSAKDASTADATTCVAAGTACVLGDTCCNGTTCGPYGAGGSEICGHALGGCLSPGEACTSDAECGCLQACTSGVCVVPSTGVDAGPGPDASTAADAGAGGTSLASSSKSCSASRASGGSGGAGSWLLCIGAAALVGARRSRRSRKA